MVANFRTLGRGRVPVVRGRECANGSGGEQRGEFCKLVVTEGFGREEVQGAGMRIAEQALKHGQVVAERLPAGRGRGYHDMLRL